MPVPDVSSFSWRPYSDHYALLASEPSPDVQPSCGLGDSKWAMHETGEEVFDLV